jgi:hypothetical protein
MNSTAGDAIPILSSAQVEYHHGTVTGLQLSNNGTISQVTARLGSEPHSTATFDCDLFIGLSPLEISEFC